MTPVEKLRYLLESKGIYKEAISLMKQHNALKEMEGKNMIVVTDIDWETDGEDVNLPTKVVINLDKEKIDDPAYEVADWLSDRYGWLVNNFNFKKIK